MTTPPLDNYIVPVMHWRQSEIFREVVDERLRQNAKWGDRNNDPDADDNFWLKVLGEEFGEVCKTMLDNDPDELRKELIQVTAVAVAWLEKIATNEQNAEE